MSTRVCNRLGSSTSTRNARSGRVETLATQKSLATVSLPSAAPEVLVSSRSSSPAAELYRSPEFQLEWDNSPAFHVAQQSVMLRRHRGCSQAELAARMGTSQSAVARIESGDENITLRTLARLVAALEGRLRLSIEPKEFSQPRLPQWFEAAAVSSLPPRDWQYVGTVEASRGASDYLVSGWVSTMAAAGRALVRVAEAA